MSRLLSAAISAALVASTAAPVQAEFLDSLEITAELKSEFGYLTRNKQFIGEARTQRDASVRHDRAYKWENSAKLFVNGELGENTSFHVEANAIYDHHGINSDWRGHRLYSQHDWLREAYVDHWVGEDWLVGVGKKQVVWGTADGIKLLDIINPTDFREFSQADFEESRIPVWMITAERNIGDDSNIQFVVSQPKENLIPGLNSSGDRGHPFLVQGVDTITGPVNGFLNIAPRLANVAGSFTNATQVPMFPIGGGMFAPNPLASPLGLVPFSGFTVDAFATPGSILPFGNPRGVDDLNLIAQNGLFPGDPNANNGVTNLLPTTGPLPTDVVWNPNDPTSAFENMAMATFATFNTFANFDPTLGPMGAFTGATSRYVQDRPSDTDANAGFRFKQSTKAGLNYSVNYFYHYSTNPSVDVDWYDRVTGERLTEQLSPAGDFADNMTFAPGPDGMPDLADFTTSLTRDMLPNDLTMAMPTTTLLRNGAGAFSGAFDPTGGFGVHNTNPSELRFTESLHRVHSLGASFDYALDTPWFPVVLRGEFLYDKDDRQPVIDRKLLQAGALATALTSEKADYFKYVLGVDVTVLTNLLISTQFIQFRNLDFVDDQESCRTQTGIVVDCSRYTGDFATLGLTNDFHRGQENKEFVSLFFSKPIGPEQQGRLNNITIFEDEGGKWNRLDGEWAFNDQLVGTFAWNHYFGDPLSTFGQLRNSSNLQVGVKFLID